MSTMQIGLIKEGNFDLPLGTTILKRSEDGYYQLFNMKIKTFGPLCKFFVDGKEVPREQVLYDEIIKN